MTETNRHASALIVADRGIVIMGASGAGKTALALMLIREAASEGRFGRLIADDQILLSACAGRLLARRPSAIAGLAEARGFGPAQILTEPAAVIDLAVVLDAAGNAPRLAEPQRFEYGGANVDQLILPARDAIQSTLAIAAWFGWAPFGRERALR